MNNTAEGTDFMKSLTPKAMTAEEIHKVASNEFEFRIWTITKITSLETTLSWVTKLMSPSLMLLLAALLIDVAFRLQGK